MTQPKSVEPSAEPRLLRGWISRYDLAQELGAVGRHVGALGAPA